LLNNDRFTHVCITTHTDEVSIGFPLSFSSFFFLNQIRFFLQILLQDKYNIGVLTVNIEFMWLCTKQIETLAKARLSPFLSLVTSILYLPSIHRYCIFVCIYIQLWIRRNLPPLWYHFILQQIVFRLDFKTGAKISFSFLCVLIVCYDSYMSMPSTI
jgi:hypothetical protein